MNTIKKPLLFAITLAVLLFIITWVKSNNVQMAPNVSFSDIDGKQHSLTQYADKPILMIFWATDCPGCVQEMPELNALYHDYADKGLAMIGVAMSHDTPEHINAMRKQRKLPYTLTWDQNDEIATAFNRVRVTPTHFLIAPNGEIVMRKNGTMNFEHLREKIDSMVLTPA
jgi:peroxiredoxin